MTENGNCRPSLAALGRKLLTTGVGALGNRAELFMLEVHEERNQFFTVILLAMTSLFLGMVTVLLLTGTIIFLFPEQYRIYAAGAFTFLYFIGAVGAAVAFKTMVNRALSRPPFPETMEQLRKDSELLDALK